MSSVKDGQEEKSGLSWLVQKFVRSDLGGQFDELMTAVRGRSRVPGVNDHLFRVLGLRRTGNHAIVNWMEQSIPGRSLHINDIHLGANAYRARAHYPEPSKSPEYNALMQAGYRREFTPLAGLICSYEDYRYASFAMAMQRQPIDSHYGCSRSVKNVLLLRDPFNLFASRLTSGKVETKDPQFDQKELFIEHAETFLRERDGSDLVCISYNDWFTNPDYRYTIQEKLGLERRDVSTQTVTTQGGGSSFDGRSMDGQASQMRVLSRWRTMEHDPRFQALFADGELERYSMEIFGDVKALG